MFVFVLRVRLLAFWVACFRVLVLLLLIVRCAVMLGGSLFWVGYAVDLVFCFWFRCYF